MFVIYIYIYIYFFFFAPSSNQFAPKSLDLEQHCSLGKKKILRPADLSVVVSTAHSSFFDVTAGAVESPDPLKEVKEGGGGESSCPVLSGDSEAEAVSRLEIH